MKEEGIKPRYGIVNFERRKHPRFNVDLPIEYYLINSRAGSRGRAMNVSEGGLLVYLPEEVAIGQHVQLRLYFPSGSELNAIDMVAEVAWVDLHLEKGWGDYRSGLRFIEISSEHLSLLKKLLRNLSE
jgi:c-di-GMP-binding flagellar brake protein YcgR